MTRPNPHIALIYHYDLARALAGEVVDWQAIPVNVDAGREGGDLCRAAADFAKRRDLFAMPAPSNKNGEPCSDTTPKSTQAPTSTSSTAAPASATATTTSTSSPPTSSSDSTGLSTSSTTSESCDPSAVPATPTAVEQQAADPEPSTASTAVPGTATDSWLYKPEFHKPESAIDRDRLRARIKDLVDQGHEQLIRRHWPDGVPTLKHDGHSDAQLQLILACVRRVEAEVGAGWHPDDGPPPHVNTNPRASVEYPARLDPDEGGYVITGHLMDHRARYDALTTEQQELCHQIALEAHAAGRSISVSQNPTARRWSIARAVIAWAASGRTLDELWLTASNLATFEQCRDPSATLGGLISQFTIEQADRLYESATNQ